MTFALFLAAAIPTALLVMLAAWVAMRAMSGRAPARLEARIDPEPRRRR